MTDNDGRKTQREDARDDDGQGRQKQDQDGRDGWTPDAEKPQRKEDVTTDDAAGPDGNVPEGGTDHFDDFQPSLESQDYPVTTQQLRKEYGEYRVDTDAGPKPLKELLEAAESETFGSPAEVRQRVETLATRS